MSETDSGGRSPRPSLRELEVLRAVIATHKTTAAAHRLGVSQPAVSRALAVLETRVGRQLFLRDGGRLVPTPDAFALDAEAAPIFAALERLDRWPQGPEEGAVLRIMATPTLAHALASPLLIRFHAREPEARIQIEIGRSSDAVLAVADGSADLGLIGIPTAHAGVRAEPLHRSQAHVMMPAEHPLARGTVITPQDLDGLPLALVTRRFSTRARIERAFADAGVEPRVVLEASTLQFLADGVRAGLGVAIVNPFPIAFVTGRDLVFRPFEPAVVYDTAFLLPAAGVVPAVVVRFTAFARVEYRQLLPRGASAGWGSEVI
jgi:DNA-binding transcriptional LysR family regulator